ncbi:hypothetical protein [Pseudomonas sp. HLMP]|uniref:hypothetical protein n=1 Tax=Pseudomonas sp. HLMP TaxID=3153767 RepID=UPI003967A951
MSIENVTELRTVNGQTQAQRLLDEGWRILAVCVMQDGSSQYAEYHLGRAKAAPANQKLQELIDKGAFTGAKAIPAGGESQ